MQCYDIIEQNTVPQSGDRSCEYDHEFQNNRKDVRIISIIVVVSKVSIIYGM